jgi:bifunctional DNA-binding transcriptional regulator/antitoxin component of YhaV-PrlF toxin-antitoxin module
MAYTSTLNDSGTTQIPQAVRDALRMQTGDETQWYILRDGTILCRHKPVDPQRAAVDLVASKLAGR